MSFVLPRPPADLTLQAIGNSFGEKLLDLITAKLLAGTIAVSSALGGTVAGMTAVAALFTVAPPLGLVASVPVMGRNPLKRRKPLIAPFLANHAEWHWSYRFAVSFDLINQKSFQFCVYRIAYMLLAHCPILLAYGEHEYAT